MDLIALAARQDLSLSMKEGNESAALQREQHCRALAETEKQMQDTHSPAMEKLQSEVSDPLARPNHWSHVATP